MPKIAIFASGAGSNAQQIIQYFSTLNQDIFVQLIVTNSPTAGVVEVAEAAGIPVIVLKNEEFVEGNRLKLLLQEQEIDWIILAGFLRKISSTLIHEYSDKIINLHPSLLPKYGGKGMYGKHVHRAVLENNEKESGITIHLVNEEYDKGEILFQKSCSIYKGDKPADLAKKIQALEHAFFPKIIGDHILKIQP